MRLTRDLHTLTGVYALDALERAERDRFERHLRRCQPCGQEARGLQETAARLAFAVARPAPPQLRERVISALAATPQLPPPAGTRPALRPRPSWRPRLAAGMAVVGLAVVIGLGVALARSQRQLDAAQAQQKAVSTVLSAGDARLATEPTARGGRVTVVVSRSLRRVILTTAGLPSLPGGRVYQLWLIGPPRIRSAGLLPPPGAGRTGPVLAAGLERGDSLGMTVEPAGGTRQPTTTPIVVIPLYS